ncbi:MAG: alanine/glycine:cation symporter family protein [Anaerovibrio sp.]|nr:alanine/glycine:cation symporter family protein [Anaerovibrio sp.]
MEVFSAAVNNLDAVIWSMALVGLCLGAGLYLSVRLRFPQLRLLVEMVRLLFGEKKSEHGISSFQSFATTVGARVGMGNIAGIATAIFVGGPGAIFWMWVITLIGAASAFTESVLGQAYKIKNSSGVFMGGPAYYLENGLKCRLYAKVFAVLAVLGPGLLLPGVQINSLALVFEEAFAVDRTIAGFICCVFLAFIIFGSIRRISKAAEILTPFMCAIYMGFAVCVLFMNYEKIPGLLSLIVTSAIGIDQLFAGIIGSAISWGVKRGIYSNEAGMGCGAIVSAAAETSHPAKQGLIQACSIYVDTLLIGTATALLVLLTGTFNVADGQGGLLVNNAGNLEAGIKWAQYALINTFGTWSGKVLAVIIVLFVFTSLTGYCYQAEANIRYLFKRNKIALNSVRILFILASFFGCLVNADAIWALGDIGYGLLGWANIIAIILLAPKAVAILRDYELQKKQGRDPVFDPVKFGIDDYTGAWDKYKNI